MTPGSVYNVLAGGGEMGALMRSIDWSRTPVGPVEKWPQSLRTALSILLETGFPMYIAWGPGFTQFYNDSYRPILGSTKHPSAMGNSTRESFAEIWDIIGPMFEGVMDGTPTTVADFMLPLDRYGFVEECYFLFSYSPIREESGKVGGVLVTVTETSKRVIGERRMRTSQQLAVKTRDARTVAEACQLAAEVLEGGAADIPMALIYLVAADGRLARRAAAVGVPAAADHYPAAIDLERGGDRWGIAEAVRTRRLQAGASPAPAPAPLNSPDASPARLMALPIIKQGEETAFGVLLALTSHALQLDEAYTGFLSLVASQIGAAIASARALEESQARADGLAELNRAKTVFFDNVSHEFRTPLTLMLGPTEDALASEDRSLRGDDLETVYRNALRLQKLANTLLDFSRIEAGRVDAVFEPTDLSSLTRHHAGAFGSAVERAGLELVVDCPPLPQPIFVDAEMWAKVVLNLVSNAFKFTLRGRITVSLREEESAATLVVQDTGVGIAPDDLPHVFDRFYRAERVNARTHEGSGIGLALVWELVAMHGGTIAATSALGEGATFTVRIPAGSGHLPAEHVRLAPRTADPPSGAGAKPFVVEALRWLPDAPALPPPPQAGMSSARILVADDNADMRDYVSRLLSSRWTVEAVSNGAEALLAIRRARPALIISDIMMPVVDGFQLLRQLRSEPETRTIPFILLSARAGEDERVDGLSAGADDCVVKPFSARELIARVESQLVHAQVRSLEEAHAIRLASVFAHAPVGVAILRGREHVFEFANRPYLELIGRRSVVGRPLREALPDLARQVVDLLDDVFDSGEPYVGRSVRLMLEQRGDAAEEAFFDFVYQPLFEDSGVVSGIAVVAFEVTQLASARRDAEAANRTKDEFLAMLGHELRNPLAPILTALQLMRLRGIEGAERERAIIERQVKHMVGLVDDLLDVSRITRGKVQLKRSRVDLADLVAKSIEMTGPAIEERRHTLRVDVSRGLLVDGDPARLAQVIANLLTNAAKYTDPGGSIQVVGQVHDRHAVIRVIDTGIGIAPEMLPRVFDLFSQERQNIDRSQGGLGLGLAIVRSLVQSHGGSVSARSDGEGRGAEFQFRIPLASQDGEAAVSALASADVVASTGSRRVLVVDDNLDAAELLADSLSAMGHEARVAFDGPSAMEVAQAFAPDVALLDLGLPVMDGFELAERLKADPSHRALTLIALTGYGQEVDRQRTRNAGFQAHMVKPVDLAHLDEWLRADGGARRAVP